MSAHNVYDNAPLGSLIRYSDGAPRPPARFTRKLADWNRRNGLGRLVRKAPSRDRPTYSAPASITLNEGGFSCGDIILVTVTRTYPVDSDLSFKIVEQPGIGMVRILQPIGDDDELLHLAENREAATLWLARTGCCHARLEDVSADEVSANIVEGRATVRAARSNQSAHRNINSRTPLPELDDRRRAICFFEELHDV